MLDELTPGRAGWERLAARAGASPVQGYEWAQACAATVDAGRPLRLVVAGPLDDPVALAPLVRRGGHLELLGAERLGEPSDLLFADAAALRELAAGLAALHAPLLLRRLPADSPSLAALAWGFRPLGVVRARPSGAHPRVDLDAVWAQAPEGRLSARRASDLRRARRRALALGPVETELLAPAPAEVDALLDAAYAVEARSWKGREGTALALDPARGAFFRRFGRAAAARGALRVAFLRVGGARVAMQIAVEDGGRLWLLKIGHDDALARCSPGSLLLLDVLRDAARRGLSAVQLLGNAAPWTAVWTEVTEPCTTLAAYPPAAASLAGAAGAAAGLARRRWAARRAA